MVVSTNFIRELFCQNLMFTKVTRYMYFLQVEILLICVRVIMSHYSSQFSPKTKVVEATLRLITGALVINPSVVAIYLAFVYYNL